MNENEIGNAVIAAAVRLHQVIIELKSVEILNNAHKKQLLTYLKLSGKKLGYLLNFGGALMKDGIVRCVNNL